MAKYIVDKDCVLAVKKGSVVIIDDNQFNFAKAYLVPYKEEKKKEPKKKEK